MYSYFLFLTNMCLNVIYMSKYYLNAKYLIDGITHYVNISLVILCLFIKLSSIIFT